MSEADTELGIVTVLLERLNTQRLPRALDIKAKVDAGGLLDSFDVEFLEEVFTDAKEQQERWKKHPELLSVITKVMHLYHEITTKALQNEQTPKS